MSDLKEKGTKEKKDRGPVRFLIFSFISLTLVTLAAFTTLAHYLNARS